MAVISWKLLATTLLGLLLCGAPPAEAATTRRAGMRVNLPGGFSPVPSAHARRDANHLVSLLQMAGLRAGSAWRARQDRAGSPTDPQATFTAARVRVLTASLNAAPKLLEADLKAALAQATQRDDDPTLLEPRALRVAGRQGVELGWTSELPDGRRELHRYLLLPREAEVLVLSMRARDTDLKRWEAAWTGASQSLALEVGARGAAPFPWLGVGLSAGVLAVLALVTTLARSGRLPLTRKGVKRA